MLDLLDGTVLTLAAFGGLAMESMTRGQGWRFLDMGRKLERSLHTIGLLRCTLACAVEPARGRCWRPLLEIADSSMTYRRRYQGGCSRRRSSTCCWPTRPTRARWPFRLAALADDVEHLPRDPAHPGRSPEQRLMLATADRPAPGRCAGDGRKPTSEAAGRSWKRCSAS